MGARVSAATACILHRAGRLSQRSVVPGGTRAPLPFLFNQAANFRSLGSHWAHMAFAGDCHRHHRPVEHFPI